MDSRPTLTSLCMKWMTSKRWPWLIYCLQCRASGIGATDTAVSTLTIRENQLTKADMSAIAAVLETRYPLPAGGEGIAYGFANVEEGAQLWPHGLPEHANNALVTSSKFRCRASYDAATNGGLSIWLFLVTGSARRGLASPRDSYPIGLHLHLQ